MNQKIYKTDLLNKFSNDLYTQDYAKKPQIDGVKIIPVHHFVGDEGDFAEVLKLNAEGGLELMPEFKVRQINRSLIFPKSIKGWHIHLNQDDLWYVSPHQQLFVGLWDMRQNSPSADVKMRLNMGGGKAQLLLIPRGIAHGCTNFSPTPVELYYFINAQFDIDNPDEHRLAWDILGADFWTPERD